MALQGDSADAGAIMEGLKGGAEESAVPLAAVAAMPASPDDGVELPPAPSITEVPAPSEFMDPTKADNIQVAGLGDKIVGAIKGRISKAEKKLTPPLKPDPVQFVGDTAIVRPLEQGEIDRLSTVFDPKYTKGINLPRIADEMQIPSLGEYLQKLKDANAGLFEEARRGTLNFEALLDKAQGKDVDGVIYGWLKRAPGTGAPAEDVLAGLLAAVSLTKETQGAWLKAFSEIDPVLKEGGLRRAAQMMAVEAELYAKISGAGSEAGRTLYVLSQSSKMAGVDLAGRADQLASIFGAQSAKDIEHVGMMYLSMPNPSARAQFAKDGFINKSMDVLTEVYINSLLSAPATHMVNVVGNSAFMATKIVETGLAGGIGKIRSMITGNQDRARFGEAWAQIQGIKDGFVDALVLSGKTLWTEMPADMVSKIDTRTRRAIGTTGDIGEIYNEFRGGNYMAGAVNTVGVAYRLPGRALLAEDEFFKGVGYRMALHQEVHVAKSRVYDEAIAAGKTAQEAMSVAAAERARLLADPPLGMVKTAQDAAREMTFQTSFEPGSALAGAQAFLSHPVAKLFVPFFKTPTNIAVAVLERTPLALFGAETRAALARGGRDADMAMARIATGSMVMGAFAMYASGTEDDKIIIMGMGPSDPAARDAMARKKILPYSVNHRNDDGTYTSMSFARAEPFSALLAMAADYAYYARYEKDQGVLEDLSMAAVASLENYMMTQPMMQGVSQIASIFQIKDNNERAKKTIKLFAERSSAAGLSLLPGNSSGASAVSRMIDPTQRSNKLPEDGLFGEDPTQGNSISKGFYKALQKAKANNPYFNSNLEPRLNEWGEVMKQGDGSVWDFVSPFKIQKTELKPVDDELMRLGGGFQPTKDRIQGVDLNAKQFNRLIALTNELDESGKLPGAKGYNAGTALQPTLLKLMADPQYAALNDEAKVEQINHIVSLYRRGSRQQLLTEDTFLQAKIQNQ